jgi:osmoprotectant transport system permease protein
VSANPWQYYFDHESSINPLISTTAWLGALPVLVGLAIAMPIGWVAYRYKWTNPPIVSGAGLLYTIPSLLLFLLLPNLLGTGILDPFNVAVALSIYTLALLVRVVADGLASVPNETLAAATAMGYTGWQRLVKVQLPIAVPVIGAGVRVATVSNVSLVSVASIIGVSQLGQLFVDARNSPSPSAAVAPALLGLIFFFLMAFAYDLVVVLAVRVLTPWRRAVRS